MDFYGWRVAYKNKKTGAAGKMCFKTESEAIRGADELVRAGLKLPVELKEYDGRTGRFEVIGTFEMVDEDGQQMAVLTYTDEEIEYRKRRAYQMHRDMLEIELAMLQLKARR